MKQWSVCGDACKGGADTLVSAGDPLGDGAAVGPTTATFPLIPLQLFTRLGQGCFQLNDKCHQRASPAGHPLHQK